MITQTFGDFQDIIYRTHKIEKKSGTTWERMIVKLFLNHFETHCKMRNETLHGKNNESQERERLQKIIRQIQQDKFFLPKKLRKLQKKGEQLHNDPNTKLSKVRLWVIIMTDLQEYHAHREKIQIKNGGDIRTYLTGEYVKAKIWRIKTRKIRTQIGK